MKNTITCVTSVTRLLLSLPVIFSLSVTAAFGHGGHDHAFGEPVPTDGSQTDATAPTTAVPPPPLSIEPDGLKAIDLKSQPVMRGSIEQTLSLTGKVEPAGDRTYDINSPLSGAVLQVLVNVGDKVTAGTPLAVIDSLELAGKLKQLLVDLSKMRTETEITQSKLKGDIAAKQKDVNLAYSTQTREKMLWKEGIAPKKDYEQANRDYEVAKAELDSFKDQLDKAKALAQNESRTMTDAVRSEVKLMGMLDKDFDQVIATNTVTARTRLLSTVAGVVTFRDMTPGEAFDTTKKLFTVLDLQQVWVVVEAFQDQIPSLAAGQEVKISSPALQESLTGSLSLIGDTVDSTTRTLPVRIVADNPSALLKPGMAVTGEIKVARTGKDVLLIPAGSLLEEGGRTIVYVKKDGDFTEQDVVVGYRNASRIEVKGGLKDGDEIVVNGARQLYAQNLLKGSQGDKAIGDHHGAGETHSHEHSPSGVAPQQDGAEAEHHHEKGTPAHQQDGAEADHHEEGTPAHQQDGAEAERHHEEGTPAHQHDGAEDRQQHRHEDGTLHWHRVEKQVRDSFNPFDLDKSPELFRLWQDHTTIVLAVAGGGVLLLTLIFITLIRRLRKRK